MIRAALVVTSLLVVAAAYADTFDDIMATHRKALAQIKVSGAMKEKIEKIDAEFTKAMRENLDELVHTPKDAPRRNLLVSKMRKDTSDYRADLRKALGNKWDSYQRAYGNLTAPSSVATRVSEEPAKSGNKKSSGNRKGRKGA